MLLTLLAKDLRRAWRNPMRWVISLVIPFIIAGLIGLAFSPRTGGGGLGTIKLAIVDEDDSILTQMLQGMPSQRQGNDIPFDIDTQVLTRAEAMRQITDNAIAAVVIVPKGFTDDYLSGTKPVALEVVKNPAQAIHPAVIEETMALLVAVLDAASSVLGDDVAQWRALITEDEVFVVKLFVAAQLLKDAGDRLTPIRDYLSPPLVTFVSETRDAAVSDSAAQKFDLFAFLLIGIAAMFLLYMADNAMRDLYREEQFRTLDRFRTMHGGLMILITSKVLFALAVLMIGGAVMFGGGILFFGIAWKQPLVLALLLACYGFFAAGFLGLIAALAGKERRADTLNNIVIMVIALAGGCMFPPEGLPPFIREHIMPWMPTGWYATAARAVQGGDESTAWLLTAGKLLLVGGCMIAAAAYVFRKRLEKGVRA